jgi:hypothetical protein
MAEESSVLQGILMLRDLGIFDFLLPFLLFFAVIYGALDKTKVFGENKRDINSIVAFVIAMIATTTAMVTKALAGFLPWVGFIAIVIVSFLMIVALAVGDVSQLGKNKWFMRGMIIAVSLALLYAVLYALGLTESMGSFNISETDIALIIILIGAGVIGYLIFGREGTPVKSS